MTGRGRGRGGDRGGGRGAGGGGGDRGRGGGGGWGDRGRGADRGRGGGGDRGAPRGGSGDRGGDRGRGRGAPRGHGGPPGGGGAGPPAQGAAQDTNYSVSTVNIRADASGVKRPSYGTSGRVIQVVVNCFKCDVPTSRIYHYDVIAPADKTLPQRATMKIIRAMQDQHPTVFTKKASYDGKANLYAPIPYNFGEAGQFPVTQGGRPYQVKLKLARRIDPETLARYIQGNMTHDENVLTAINACNVAIRSRPIEDNPFNARSFFTRAESRNLGKGLELWRGYFQSVRPATGRLVINVDISSAAFYKEGPLVQLCLEYLGIPVSSDPTPHLSASMPRRQKNDLLKFIRNLDVKTEKKDDTRIRSIKDFSERGADEHIFQMDGETTTVAAYCSRTVGRLRWPKLLSVKLSKLAYVPLERCVVVPGQLMRKQLPQEMMQDVLTFSTMRPEQRLQSIRNALQVLQYGNSPYLQDLGINVSATPMQIQARILTTPTLLYKNASIQPENGMWNMRDKKLWKPAAVQGAVMIIYDRRFRQDSEGAVKQGLFDACRSLGITGMPNAGDIPVLRKDPAGGRYLDDIREAGSLHARSKKVNPNLVIVVLPDFGSEDIYIGIKHAGDILIGVTTQCLKGSKCFKANNPQYWANVCLKMNVKLGGINVIPKPDTVRFLTDPANPTLVMGADVMHPGPGIEGRPSYAAVTGNVDSDTSKYIATSRAQKPRQEMIEELDAMVFHVLQKYILYRREVEKKPNPNPKRIIFYRDGISEGQFEECKKDEVKKIKAACTKAKIPMPALTFIVVGKRHHVRFFPTNARDADRSGNAPAGLVVDRDITSPVEFDFYLQSHGGLLGTSRSAHYNVLVDENRFTPDDLQKLSFSLCHVYARATRSVSIVPPVYYADTVCARARHHFAPGTGPGSVDDSATQTSQADPDAQLALFQQRFRQVHQATGQTMYFQ